MPSINKLPTRVDICCSPTELRKLADKMEATIAKTALGESTLVEVWQANSVELLFHFDQEASAMINTYYHCIEDLRSGDILIANELMRNQTSVALTVAATPRYDPAMRLWIIPVKEQPDRSIVFSREALEGKSIQVRRKR